MKTTIRILSFILILVTLAACTPAPTALPTATASATPTIEPSATPIPPTATPTPEPTPSATPTEIIPVFEVDFDSLTPESIEDVAGVVRWDKLQADLAILHQEIFEALEADGVTADQLPLILVNSLRPNAESAARGFFPSEYDGLVQIVNFNEQSQVRAVLSALDTGEGYVLTMPVCFYGGSGEILLVDFVIDFKLLAELEAKRVAAGSEYELINEAFVIENLIPNLKVNFQPNFFGPFGELSDEYLPYVGRVVEAGPNTGDEEIGAQIKEGKVFVVVKCNINY